MTKAAEKILVAVAWPYASGPRHIGHVAGFGVPSDIFARYHRLKGNDVLMVSGTDEHGTPIMVAADREGVSPRELVDRYSAVIRDDLRRLGLSYDLFTRTTTTNHHEVVRDVFRTLYEHGFIVERHDPRRVLGRHGPDAPGPVHRGDLPHLRLPGGARRPVRQLREPARPDRPHRAALQDRRHAAGLPRDGAPLPRPPGVRGAARGLDRRARPLALRTFAASRSSCVDELAAAPDHARSRLGRSDSRSGLRGARRQADLRLVRRGDRLPLRLDRVGGRPRRRPTPGASGGRTRRRGTTTSWARTTSSSTASSGRACCSGTATAASSARGGASSSCRTTSSRASS